MCEVSIVSIGIHDIYGHKMRNAVSVCPWGSSCVFELVLSSSRLIFDGPMSPLRGSNRCSRRLDWKDVSPIYALNPWRYAAHRVYARYTKGVEEPDKNRTGHTARSVLLGLCRIVSSIQSRRPCATQADKIIVLVEA